ncbi:IS66 family insertion sequence element accessory protein TnpB [Aliiroseovarius halocynthiae]|uniref:Transposase n=1 Tax=Aliiroseovarius halocynthiae TaxID=985055 RepID=A0A545SLU8_9RHOB|nr:IS66 family insertion sequence element accessory protein TnpB [Aliiroseovarius halocynthiae]TQV65957.1 transposase [Aliiroseovarius halocynthiae]
MISPAGNFKFYVATKPVDFRKGMDGLAAIVQNEFDLDPFSGAFDIFDDLLARALRCLSHRPLLGGYDEQQTLS